MLEFKQAQNKNTLRVLLLTNIPSPYMIDYLNELGKYCILSVIFELQKAVDRTESWYGRTDNLNFNYYFLNAVRIGMESGLSFKVVKYLKSEKYDRIIIANPTTPTGVVSLLFCRWFRVPYIIQSEGGFQGSRKGIKEYFKKYLMEKADFYLTGMGGDNDYFLCYGATKEKLKVFPFTSMKNEDLLKAQMLLNSEKLTIRAELGMVESKIILSVGRFSYKAGYGKGFDILMRIAEFLPSDMGVYIVGDEPTQEFIDWKKKKQLEHVHFINFLQPNELAKYYYAADVFVLLTRGDTWGLAINEAMSYGLPIITTDKCVAGVQLIESGVNGYVLSLEDENVIKKHILSILEDESKKDSFGKINLKKIQSYTIENMAYTIFSAII